MEVVLGSSRAVRLIDKPAGDEDERKKREREQRKATPHDLECQVNDSLIDERMIMDLQSPFTFTGLVRSPLKLAHSIIGLCKCARPPCEFDLVRSSWWHFSSPLYRNLKQK
ncbi:hypothetical protein IRJ41_010120 [Triplophysa rosa]|uniref:Uncharacterized protein n=1 Tax=Triplophysa rosa TaxID=992332 RepID=A0A9W7WKK2_TRIRA|nr:hypothetical protein IRJ41_010120 [Triplophysa rosa]